MRIPVALLCGAGSLLIAALPLMAQTEPAAPPEQAQHRELPRPKNLQVLPKDISGPTLIATMRGYARALGVECGFCHAEDASTHRVDFASDAKPDKGIARTMIRMTGEINAKYLSTVQDPDATPADKTVTCGTCHRGNQMPAPFMAGKAEHHSMPAKQ
ncbi:MAG TPA: c-type cytochrome [Silvibacterium sp.]|nr:c-type cytochrome [Silvibacterium sp.]